MRAAPVSRSGHESWGPGPATEGAHRLVAVAFRRELRRLDAVQKCGFAREAVMRAAYVDRNGAVCDGLLYALLAKR